MVRKYYLVFSDKRIPVENNGVIDYYVADITTSSDYYPFGSPMDGRTFYSPKYRFGFNGQEKNDEVAGNGNTNTALFWEYDIRLGRRWNLDPKPQINISDYAVMGNNPIFLIDPYGDEVKTVKERYKTMKDGSEKKLSRFSLRKADRIEITHTVISMKLYDATKSVNADVKQRAATEIQSEILEYWNTTGRTDADANGYITNKNGQKIKVTTVFEKPIEVVDDVDKIERKDHVVLVLPTVKGSEYSNTTKYLSSNIIFTTPWNISGGYDGTFAHEWGHVGGLHDVMIYRYGCEKVRLMYNGEPTFGPRLRVSLLEEFPKPSYNELKRAVFDNPEYLNVKRFLNFR